MRQDINVLLRSTDRYTMHNGVRKKNISKSKCSSKEHGSLHKAVKTKNISKTARTEKAIKTLQAISQSKTTKTSGHKAESKQASQLAQAITTFCGIACNIAAL